MRLGLDADRLLPIEPSARAVARRLYESVSDAPILSPHGHVDPRLLLDDLPFSDPVELLVRHDHYVTRLLHAAGTPLERLGLDPKVAVDPREVWRIFCSEWHRFAGTASGYWLSSILVEQFGIDEHPDVGNADALYDAIAGTLATPASRPRALFARFGIEVLATTDDPLDDLEAHRALAADAGFGGRVIPTFRPDAYLDPESPGFGERIERLGATTFAGYLDALAAQRAFFVENGAVSADHGVLEPYTDDLDDAEAARLFDAARVGTIGAAEARAFRGRMLLEMARMSVDDGLVATIHAGVQRNHHTATFERFGPDTGHDIPVATEWVHNLRPLLQRFGADQRLHFILFTVDGTTYSRGSLPWPAFYPAVFLGAPWWFLDAPDAVLRFRAATTETAGFHRGSGFVDDTRAFLSIPARHDMARRVDAAFLARLVGEGRLDEESAARVARDLVDAIPPDGVAPVTALARAALGLDTPPVRIVHLGLGNFQRAHQAWYTEHAADRADWGIAAFAVRTGGLADRLTAQDGLYSLIERGPETDDVSVIGSLVEAHPGDSPRLAELLAAPTTAVVTLTITEAGYRLDDRAPLALSRLVMGLEARRMARGGPIAIVCCDNLPANGAATRTAVLGLATALDRSLAGWIDEMVSFVSTSVDRITPRLTDAELDGLRTASGWEDAAPVVTEPFSDWVLQGDFSAGRPQWESAGARFVDDVEPFERRKLWLLNGAHTILAASGPGRGHETVADSFADPACRTFVTGFWDEAERHLTTEELDIPGYLAQLRQRFSNPRIAHRLTDIADQAPTKVRVRLLPVLLAEWAAGRSGAATLRALADAPELLAILTEGTPMRIDKAEVIVTSPDRNFVTLKLTTDDGLTGLGDATLNGRELAVVSYLKDHVAPLLIGLDPHRIEDTWQFLYRGAYWRRGPVTMAAISAVDVALWDIKAKAANMPLYQLLGGASRTGLLAYGHASGKTTEELFDSVRSHLSQGYRAIRIQSGVPGLNAIYGIASNATSAGNTGVRYDHEPAQRGAFPAEEDWDTRAYLRHIPGVFEAVRNEFGAELPLLHDGHHRMTPIQAAKLGKSLEPYDLFWLEDCTPAENQEALRLVRQHTTTPLAIGEIFNTVWDYQQLIREQLIDYVRSAVTHTGGITHLKRILEYAGQYQIKSGMHGPTDISPVGMAAAMHLGLSIHNFGIQEYMKHGAKTDAVFHQSFSWNDGLLHPGEKPGLGVDLDLDEAGKYPYETAYLPYNRLADGTVHDW